MLYNCSWLVNFKLQQDQNWVALQNGVIFDLWRDYSVARAVLAALHTSQLGRTHAGTGAQNSVLSPLSPSKKASPTWNMKH